MQSTPFMLVFQPAEEADVMSQEEGVDTFTLLHESVYAYSNPVSSLKQSIHHSS